ncbi:MAG: hypothetical protein OES13_09680 [Acidimicrobiia bacterium]|nr:hypothetical protein [Acidimicrobiia bacterium]
MPIFPVPPVGPEDGGHIVEVIREIVGNRDYERVPRPGEGRAPKRRPDKLGARVGIRARLRRLFRR